MEQCGRQVEQRCCAAANNRKEDAHLLYVTVFASSCFAAPVELRTFIASKRDDFFAVDVMRHFARGVE